VEGPSLHLAGYSQQHTVAIGGNYMYKLDVGTFVRSMNPTKILR